MRWQKTSAVPSQSVLCSIISVEAGHSSFRHPSIKDLERTFHMRNLALLMAGGAVACFLTLATAAPALAWGCKAQGNGTSYGYSHSYDNRSDAERRAISECRARPNAGSCYITNCNPND
jgi:hypothetical protein